MPQGEITSVCGTTVLVCSSAKGDEKAGTSDVRQGEQLVTAVPFAGEGKGKPINAFRVRKGLPVTVSDSNIAPLVLPPEKQRLSFHARKLDDETVLWDIGVRQDDVIVLEFESPVTPAVLQLLREEKPKGEKKGKGGGGKKKKGK